MNPSLVVAERQSRILVVDDEPTNRQLLEVMLAPEGYRVLTAASGEDALALIGITPPDLILLDIMMPGMDGHQVAAALKANVATKSIPIIMVTALDDRAARMHGLRAGAEDFLTKPVDRAELCVRVRNLLRLKAYSDYHDRYSQILEGEVAARSAALVESEARFRQIAESVPEMFFLLDPLMTQAFYVSPAYEQIYGRTCDSMYANPASWVEAIHPDDREALRAAIAPEGPFVPFDAEYRIVRPDGSVRLIRAHGRPLYNSAGDIYRVAGVAEDITERRTLEGQLRQASKMDAIGQLASGVAHDFNNLLTVILGFSEMIAADPALPDQPRKDLSEVVEAARRASGLTKQLLAFSRKQEMNTTTLDVNGVITGMTTMLGRLIGAQVEVTLTLAPALSLVLADRGQLEQVVMNLVVNARDAMPRGGRVTIETRDVELENSSFHEETVERGQYVMLAVTDTGCGMSQETQRRLFEPFFTTKKIGEGTGLGLPVVYGIVKQCKGYIWLYSELGRGTTFKVYLPHAEPALRSEDLRSAATVTSARPTETVMVVDDESAVRQFSRRILEHAGYGVWDAANADEAERLFAKHADTIALVVTDIVMRGCYGPELTGRLRRHTPAVKALYMSGYSRQSAARRAEDGNCLPFIQKPFTTAEFLREVREAIDRA